ncbi:hypothetical protein QYE76_044693 [Lolium multiflorum]|uniref:Transposase (putative) gypsy type domain-containing protein n=1 Tax=Lolium multiflorum TaxID=4521 RepID=A0AAD8TJN8_LOLMU|nr:hypothetical protein QYE76_044693 [Lolium multiflorum]
MATPISSTPPPFVPVKLGPSKDSGKETEGTSANPEKASGEDQAEHKAEEIAAKKSKARQRDAEAKGKWWPCTTTKAELMNLEAEGFLQPGSWRSVPNALAPAPEDNEMVLTKALVERGFSFPPSDFFLEILKVYGLQPHNISPNSVLAISNHVTLCEGHLRVTPELSLFQYYFTVKKERIRNSTELATCGSITFMIRPGRVYPHTDRHESARYWRLLLLEGRFRPGEHKEAATVQELPRHQLPTWDASPPPLRVAPPHTRRRADLQADLERGPTPPKAPKVLKKKVKPSPASVPVTPEVEVPPKASSASKPDPKDVIDLEDLPEDPADHGDSAKGASSSAPPQGQPGATFAEPTEEEYEEKVKLVQASNAIRVDPRPTQSLQKLTLAQRHTEVSAMLNKITEIEGLRQNAENSQKAIQLLETRLHEETAKHSSFDELSAKVKVLEAENESLKAFIQESSNKETEARKELSEKHARDLAELNEKLKKSQGRVTSLVGKNKVLEAEAEAIDKLIFPSLGFDWSKESNPRGRRHMMKRGFPLDALSKPAANRQDWFPRKAKLQSST